DKPHQSLPSLIQKAKYTAALSWRHDHFSVLLFTTPSRAGKWNSVIRVNNEPEITLWQFIYP
ncbi:hypothetical protein ACOY6A_20095, partial [Enterobacter roggenkampii]